MGNKKTVSATVKPEVRGWLDDEGKQDRKQEADKDVFKFFLNKLGEIEDD